MYSLKSVRFEPVTPELAREIASLPGFPGERDICPRRMQYLRWLVKQGRFARSHWAIAVHRVTGETFRINGRRTSTMLASLTPEEFPAGLNVVVEVFEFDNLLDDAMGMFNLFDFPSEEPAEETEEEAETNRILAEKFRTMREQFQTVQEVKRQLLREAPTPSDTIQ